MVRVHMLPVVFEPNRSDDPPDIVKMIRGLRIEQRGEVVELRYGRICVTALSQQAVEREVRRFAENFVGRIDLAHLNDAIIDCDMVQYLRLGPPCWTVSKPADDLETAA